MRRHDDPLTVTVCVVLAWFGLGLMQIATGNAMVAAAAFIFGGILFLAGLAMRLRGRL